MLIGFVDFLFSALIAILAVLAVWFWRKTLRVSSEDESSSGSQLEQAELMLARLHDLAAGVAANVGEHNSQVEAINVQLAAESGSDTSVVVTAVSQLLAANSRMQQQLDSAQEQLRQQAEEIESQTAAARTDALTGLLNRRVFDDEIAVLTEQFHEQGTPFTVTILDIDHFKKFNDVHGHQVGDRVLQHAAAVYLKSVPDSDIVTRFGGEEFAIIHPAITLEEATSRADLIRQALDDSRIHREGRELHVTASLGVAQSRLDEEPADLIERADAALYAAKESGRNRTYWHDGSESRAFVPQSHVVEEPQPKAAPVSPPPKKNLLPKRNTRLQQSLLDRPRFIGEVAKLIAASDGETAVPTVFLVSADRFDDHVDRYGDDTGERLLDAIATVLLAVTRDQGFVATFDRQTFAVLVLGYGLAQALQVAEQIRKLSHQCPLPTQTGSIQFSLSIGAAQALDNEKAASVLGRAEEALHSAARAGGDGAFFHNGKWTEIAQTVISDTTCTT